MGAKIGRRTAGASAIRAGREWTTRLPWEDWVPGCHPVGRNNVSIEPGRINPDTGLVAKYSRAPWPSAIIKSRRHPGIRRRVARAVGIGTISPGVGEDD